jgi:hypothetical protein
MFTYLTLLCRLFFSCLAKLYTFNLITYILQPYLMHCWILTVLNWKFQLKWNKSMQSLTVQTTLSWTLSTECSTLVDDIQHWKDEVALATLMQFNDYNDWRFKNWPRISLLNANLLHIQRWFLRSCIREQSRNCFWAAKMNQAANFVFFPQKMFNRRFLNTIKN